MSSLLARLGQLEVRTATQTLWRPGKRKRGEWGCTECRARRLGQQKRWSSDEGVKLPNGGYIFPQRDELRDDDEEGRETRGDGGSGQPGHASGATRYRAWGQDADGSDSTPLRQQRQDSEEQATLSFAQGAEDGSRAADIPWSSSSGDEALWEAFEQIEDDSETEHAASADSGNNDFQTQTTTGDVVEAMQDTAGQSALSAGRDESLLDLDYAAELSPALLRGEVDLVTRCIYAATRADDLDFIRGIPATTFSEIIDLLQPSNFIDRLATAHLEISNVMTKRFRIASMSHVAWEYQQLLSDIIAMRRSAGIKLGLADFRILLRSARGLGDKLLAQKVWQKMAKDGVIPDTACYNAYMGALVWHGMHLADTRYKVRVIPLNMLARRTERLGKQYCNYRVVGDGGIRSLTISIFGAMLRNGAVADEESFHTVIVAAAREGDISTVKSVLRKVWEIDVDALMAGKPETDIAPRKLSSTSPLYPTSKLLFVLAHAFSINNDMLTALRAVDFVARQYVISTTHEVWAQLFEWTFALSVPRYGTALSDGSTKGQLPMQSVLSLWQTMISAPYHVKPTMGMYNLLIKNLWYRHLALPMFEKMQEARHLFRQASRQDPRREFNRLRQGLEEVERGRQPRESLEKVRRQWEDLELIRQRDRFWFKRWVRLALNLVEKQTRLPDYSEWGIVDIPSMLWEWRHLTPQRVSYTTQYGTVEFYMRGGEDMLENALELEAVRMEREEVLDRVRRYVGEQWVATPWVPPKRLAEHRERTRGGEEPGGSAQE